MIWAGERGRRCGHGVKVSALAMWGGEGGGMGEGVDYTDRCSAACYANKALEAASCHR